MRACLALRVANAASGVHIREKLVRPYPASEIEWTSAGTSDNIRKVFHEAVPDMLACIVLKRAAELGVPEFRSIGLSLTRIPDDLSYARVVRECRYTLVVI